jgi:uncharacterized tellurite resistance protein B-like protein
MNLTDVSDHSIKKQNLEYFIHLVRIAKADDVISSNELELLHQIGNKLRFTEHEIDTLIESTGKSDYIPPYELSARFEQIYEIVKMTLSDGVIDKNEMRLASNFATKSGFTENEIPGLLVLLLSGIKQGKNEEELFEQYKKERKTRPEQLYCK